MDVALVKPDQYTPESIHVMGINGVGISRKLARVWMYVDEFYVKLKVPTVKERQKRTEEKGHN